MYVLNLSMYRVSFFSIYEINDLYMPEKVSKMKKEIRKYYDDYFMEYRLEKHYVTSKFV